MTTNAYLQRIVKRIVIFLLSIERSEYIEGYTFTTLSATKAVIPGEGNLTYTLTGTNLNTPALSAITAVAIASSETNAAISMVSSLSENWNFPCLTPSNPPAS